MWGQQGEGGFPGSRIYGTQSLPSKSAAFPFIWNCSRNVVRRRGCVCTAQEPSLTSSASTKFKTQNLFGGLSMACDFADLVQNGFCTRPVAPLQGSFGPRSCTSSAVSRLNIHPPNRLSALHTFLDPSRLGPSDDLSGPLTCGPHRRKAGDGEGQRGSTGGATSMESSDN